MSGPHAAQAHGALPQLPSPEAPPAPGIPPAAYDPRMGGALVWLVDIEAARDGGTLPQAGRPHAAAAHGARPPEFRPAGGLETIRVSDLGWHGALPYPPLLIGGPDIERRVALAPGAADTFAWGIVSLASPGLVSGTALEGRDTALRRLRVRAGLQGWDPTRGLVTDPPASGLIDVFNGIGMTWRARDGGAEVPLRDPSAWLDAPIGIRRYLGTGGSEGPAELAGQPWPIVRGGSALAPVRSCGTQLLDNLNQLYRWSDRGTVTALYEDGAPVYTSAGLVPDCATAGSPGAGRYYHDARGQVRLGSQPQGVITVDGYSGSFLAALVLRDLLRETLALPAGMLDEGSVIATAASVPYAGGWAWTGRETAREAIQPLLAALGARLVASRSGGLRLWPLRALTASARPVALLDPSSAVSVVPVPLDAPLVPPAAAWTVGYGRTHITTTTPKPSVSAEERARLAQPYRTAPWADPANLTRYAQASRPDVVETALLQRADALAMAAALGGLWGVPRTLWQVTMPTASALLREIGDVVSLAWPADGLRAGPLGQVVGDSIRAGADEASLLILV
nr:hypothetical protein [uncultured Roseococcus sp.]